MTKDDSNAESVVLYTTPDGAVRVQAIVRNETLWLTQLGMAELFEVDKSSISRHLKNIFASGELDEKVVVAKIETTTQHGAISGKTQSKDTNFYNLDAIIAVGYRVNSARATHFRIWATGVLREYIIKGFALDDNRLKNGGNSLRVRLRYDRVARRNLDRIELWRSPRRTKRNSQARALSPHRFG